MRTRSAVHSPTRTRGSLTVATHTITHPHARAHARTRALSLSHTHTHTHTSTPTYHQNIASSILVKQTDPTCSTKSEFEASLYVLVVLFLVVLSLLVYLLSLATLAPPKQPTSRTRSPFSSCSRSCELVHQHHNCLYNETCKRLDAGACSHSAAHLSVCAVCPISR